MAINKKTIQKAIGAFIPQHIPNRMVMGVMGLLTIFKTSKRQVAQNREHNYELLVEKENSKETGQFFIPGEYIENQAQWGKVRFGKKYTMAYGGCEVFATYNALVALGQEPDGLALTELISRFERKGVVLGGYLGSAPKASYYYFKEKGCRVKLVTGRDKEVVNTLGREYKTIIATVYNDGHDIFRMVHTVNISKDEKGQYFGHNCYKRGRMADGTMGYVSHGPYETLWEVISNMSTGNAEMLVVMGIG